MKAVVISVRVRDGSYLASSLVQLKQDGHDIDVCEFDYGDIDNDPDTFMEVLDSIEDADILFIWVSGNLEYFKNHKVLMKKAATKGVVTYIFNANRERAEENRDVFEYPDEDYDQIYNYALMGGSSNFRAIGLWMLNRFCNENNELPEPITPLAQGVYFPGCSDTSFETYIP